MPLERIKAIRSSIARPWRLTILVLCVLFGAEYGLMHLLPWLFPHGSPHAVAAVDSTLVAVVAVPLLWWTLVRPLEKAAKLRDHVLSSLFTTIEDERRRIARELHDGVGQTLTLLVSGLRSLQATSGPDEITRRKAEFEQLAQRALEDTKSLARGLRPSLLDDLGLAVAIERVAAEVEEHQHLRVLLELDAMAKQRLPERIETAVFRIFQEAMANLVKHSGATTVTVRLSRRPKHVVLSISDNGCGIAAAPGNAKLGTNGRQGLIGMQERATLLGGSFAIDSVAGKGTTITVALPV